MMNSVNLMGRMCHDPELKKTASGMSVVSFRIAVDRTIVRQGKEREADFIDIVAWQQTADVVARFFRKGSIIAVQGSIQTRSYEDKNGNKRTAFEVVASNVFFCERKPQTQDDN